MSFFKKNNGTAGATNNSDNNNVKNNNDASNLSKQEKSSDTSIYSISVNDVLIKDIDNEMNIEVNRKNVNIVVITNDKKATSRIEGNQNELLIDKVNSFTIIVTAEDGSEKNYLLNITRKETKSNVTIVMGEPDSKTRNAEVTNIFDYVYAQYALNKLVDTNTILKTVDVEKANIFELYIKYLKEYIG